MYLKEGRTIGPPLQNKKGSGTFETLLVCILVSILIGTVIPYYQTLAKEARETVLQTDLASVRKSIELYTLLRGKFPPDLRSLVHERYVIPVREDTFISKEYLRALATDAEGNLVDPFGNQYHYDDKNGIVHSGTRGYEKW